MTPISFKAQKYSIDFENILQKSEIFHKIQKILQNSDELPSMLKPGSSKLKESEAELLQEIHEFELQEDKTLDNMEETKE